MPSSVRAASCGALDFHAQCRDLFAPAFTQERIGTMPSTPYRIGQDQAVGSARASSHAGIASTGRKARQQERVDFLTGYCGLSLPTLFKKIGTMAADGQPFPPRLHTTRLRRVRRLKLARHAGNPFAGPVLPAGPPVKTTPASIASGPAQAPSQVRLDNRIRPSGENR